MDSTTYDQFSSLVATSLRSTTIEAKCALWIYKVTNSESYLALPIVKGIDLIFDVTIVIMIIPWGFQDYFQEREDQCLKMDILHDELLSV